MPTAPAGLDAVLERALAKDPAERFRSSRAFVQALEELSRPPVPAPAGGTWTYAGRWWTLVAAFSALVAMTWTFGMVACRMFEVFLREDSEFSASLSDYFRVGREALIPFVPLWILTALATAAVAGAALLVRWRAAHAWHAWSGWWNRLPRCWRAPRPSWRWCGPTAICSMR
jgi:hypothetical protein